MTEAWIRCSRIVVERVYADIGEQSSTRDVICMFRRANGSMASVLASELDALPRSRLMRVRVVQRFKRITQVRCPDGDMLHVKNFDLNLESPQFEHFTTALALTAQDQRTST